MKKCLGLCLILALLWSVAAAEAPADSPERFALTADTAVNLDLNGDGTEESVLWHCEKVGEYEDESVELTVTSASGDAVTLEVGSALLWPRLRHGSGRRRSDRAVHHRRRDVRRLHHALPAL